jgi:hypothetical protein
MISSLKKGNSPDKQGILNISKVKTSAGLYVVGGPAQVETWVPRLAGDNAQDESWVPEFLEPRF